MTKDDLIVFLTDAVLWRGSVTGNIKFGTDDDDLLEFEDRASAQNDEFRDLINCVIELTGREIKPDPRDVRRAEMKRRFNQAAWARKAEAEAKVK